MGAFLAIVRLTCMSALRSHIFQLLLFVLVLSVVVIPNTISGDGTASGYIQISLKYSLGFVGFILSLSTVWLGCVSMTSDVENYQLHMVITKPVPRVVIWLGKCAGVILINASLLLIAGLVIYAIVTWQFSRQGFKPEERRRMENEVMVGRRVFYPKLPDIDAMTRAEYQSRMAALSSSDGAGAKVRELGEKERRTLWQESRKKVISSLAELRPGEQKSWKYEGLPLLENKSVFLRYRMYIGKVSTQDQRFTAGIWAAGMSVPVEAGTGNPVPPGTTDKPVEMKRFVVQKSMFPDQMMCGIFNELELNPAVVDKDGSAELFFTNYDPQRQPMFFQVVDGPRLLVRVAGFFENYMRGLGVILLRLVILAALSCSFASFLSMPVAVFFVFSYLFFGGMATFVAAGDVEQLGTVAGDTLAWHVSRILLYVVIPMQNFEVSQHISGGEVIEMSRLGGLFLVYFVFKTLPLVAFSMWLYQRREMGLVVRK